MKVCEKCGQKIYSKEEFEQLLGKPYLQAISDKTFLESLEKGGFKHGEK
jgi:hypothetical protein